MIVPAGALHQGRGLARAGGACLVAAGIIGLVWFVFSGWWPYYYLHASPWGGYYDIQTRAWIASICFAIPLLTSTLALLGGVHGMRRRSFGLAMVGGIAGIFSFGFLIGAILSLLGLIMTSMSQHEFQQRGDSNA